MEQLVRLAEDLRRFAQAVVDPDEIVDVVVRAAGKAVRFVAGRIKPHARMPVFVLRIETAKRLVQIDPFVFEICAALGFDPFLCLFPVHGILLSLCPYIYYSIRPLVGRTDAFP